MVVDCVIEVLSKKEELPKIVDYTENFLLGKGFAKNAVLQMAIAAEEIFINICHYAYHPSTGRVKISFSADKNSAKIVFSDDGKPFNPLSDAKEPNTTLPAKEREQGGLGIFMAKQFASCISYDHADGTNILTIIKEK